MIQYVTYQDNRKSGNKLWYGRAIHPNTVDLDHLADRIQRSCSLTKGDVLACLTELVVVMNDELQSSNAVKLNGFGTFKIGLKTVGADIEKEFNANDNIKGFRVNFLPEGSKTNGVFTRVFTNGLKVKKA